MMRPVRFHFDNVYSEKMLACGPFCVLQFGDLAAEPGYVCPPHVQQVHEVSCVVSGKGVFTGGGREFPVSAGDVFLNPTGDIHAIVSDDDNPLRYFYLGFTFSADAAVSVPKEVEELFSNPPSVISSGGEIRDLFVSLFDDYLVDDGLRSALIAADILKILTAVYRAQKNGSRRSYATNESGKKRLFLDVVHYIDHHCQDMDALSRLSAEFGYSYSSISALFCATMGKTLKEYYTDRRFARALTCLNDGMRVGDTASYLGYLSIHSFSRAFHRYFGVSPRDYKKIPLRRAEFKEDIS